jgi:hypothetical protein
MHPLPDLELALAHGDRQFIGVMGYSVFVPAISPNAECLRLGGVKVVAGTSDDIRSEAFGTWQSLVIGYAKVYNKTLAAHFRANAPSSCPEWDDRRSQNAP